MREGDFSNFQKPKFQGQRSCRCDQKYYYCIKASWKSNDLKIKPLIQLIRYLSGGISQIVLKGQDISHDFIEMEVFCSNCENLLHITADWAVQKRCLYGKYQNNQKLKINKQMEIFCQINDIARVISETQTGEYQLLNNNCKHWAKKLWKKLQQF